MRPSLDIAHHQRRAAWSTILLVYSMGFATVHAHGRLCQPPCCIFAVTDTPTSVALLSVLDDDWACDVVVDQGAPRPVVPDTDIVYHECTPAAACWSTTANDTNILPADTIMQVVVPLLGVNDTSVHSNVSNVITTVYEELLLQISMSADAEHCGNATNGTRTNHTILVRLFPWWWSALDSLKGIDTTFPNEFCGSILLFDA
jgi:hypothetical protein